jgi:Fe-S cluster assembly ATP-binding protein
MSVLEIRDLHVSVDTEQGAKQILRGVNLTINQGETHAIMGPNGSGKSTLAYAIAGHPKYHVTSGSILLDGEDLTEATVDARARAGVFLAMQYPVEIPGVTVTNFLRTAKTAIAERNVNEGFSGGEKKRNEILQLELLKPKFAVLDETDSGLDVDALKIVSEGVNRAKSNTDLGVLLITHYNRILRYITPDFVHVFVAGQVVESGGPELAVQLENEGYDTYVAASAAAAAAIASAEAADASTGAADAAASVSPTVNA